MISQAEKNTTFLDQLDGATDLPKKEKSPDWLRYLRRQGLSRFRQLGIPTVKDEEWKYTNISPITAIRYSLCAKSGGRSADVLQGYCRKEDLNIVFVNGVLNEALSDFKKNHAGVEIAELQDALAAHPQALRELLGHYDPQKDSAFVALNTALARHGVCIHIRDNIIANQLIHIIHLTDAGDEKIVTFPRSLIKLGKSSGATILESHIAFNEESVYLSVPLTDIFLEENAVLHYSKAQKESLKAYHVGTTRVWQKRDSSFDGFSLAAGAAITRNNLDVVINGEGASAFLNGLYSVYKNQHVDNHTSVDHRAPNATSNQLYKGVLNDAGRAVFNGKIFVRSIAQQTNSYQLNKNLLLGKECRVDTKPQLEIFADDVRCTHGATIGQLNEDEIFYLRARAISRKAATRLLTQGFVDDLLDRLPRASIREKLARLIAPSLEVL